MTHTVLATDGYKFSMAAAGWPLRTETFHYAHRRGGPHYLPLDVGAYVRQLLPQAPASAAERAFLAGCGYDLGGGVWAALQGRVHVDALPAGTWFFDREPVFSITGPSALVSWLEPHVLRLHYRIQLATVALLSPDRLPAVLARLTCAEQRDIALETLEQVGVAPPAHIPVDPAAYQAEVRTRVDRLVALVEDPARVFEVGMRAASCTAQHRLALLACKAAGVTLTSNADLAHELGLRAVGTMGHEHVQRYGSDEAAFRAMRERLPGSSSFLLDTYDTVRSGLPTAFQLVAEEPGRRDTVRFDSGDKDAQYTVALRLAARFDIAPRLILEDGFDHALTAHFEDRRRAAGLPPEDQLYGYGGHIVSSRQDPLTRDRVAAVYKLSQTGRTPTMKFGDAPGAGKESIPGRPLLCRRLADHPTRPAGVVIQEGEAVPEGFALLTGVAGPPPAAAALTPARARALAGHRRPLYSPATEALVSQLTAARAAHLDALQPGAT